LEAVLADASGYEAVWCLGDLTGYGPNPNECVERVRALPNLCCLVGNHDKAVLGEIDLSVFNGDARAAIAWTRRQCKPGNLAYLRALPAQQRYGDFTLAHGSPRQPVWEYILDRFIAQENFAILPTRYCLVGHTHLPIIYRETGPHGECVEQAPDYGGPLQLDAQRLIINPGSVGQPRDNNPDAAYAVLDTETLQWQYYRVPYDVMATQSRMRTAQMPERLILRLGFGW
jgi:diadenosine tetraphosphatase ApaH/serine/threonine PP2A family protein phosphatase